MSVIFFLEMKFLLFFIPFILCSLDVTNLNRLAQTWVAREEPRRWITNVHITRGIRDSVQLSNTTSFDARNVYGKRCPILNQVVDQGYCGSCYAVSLANALSTNYCVAKNLRVRLSSQDIVSCDKSNFGCDGGYLDNAWNYTVRSGLLTEACFPYQSKDGVAPPCPKRCQNRLPWRKFKAKNFICFRTIQDAQNHIVQFGSIQAGFDVYEDFFYYSAGVYKHVTGELQGGHAIELVGWGDTGDTKYWIAKNSWSTTWGMKGYFWIELGTNECEIENNLYGGFV